MAKYKCRECQAKYEGNVEPPKLCPYCKVGTFVAEEADQPTAAGGTANARRSSRSDEVRSTLAEEARALTGGAAELMEYVERMQHEARMAEPLAWQVSDDLDDIYDELWRVQCALAELRKMVARRMEEAPAVSAKLSHAADSERGDGKETQ
jgi:hypothetical protein